MTQVLDWRSAADPHELLRQAVETLERGGTVAFPTEATYAVAGSALHEETVERLSRTVGRPLTLAVRGYADALEWVPSMSVIGRRLARRCWPGPLTMVVNRGESELIDRLPEPVRAHLLSSGSIRLRAPAHEALQGTLHFHAGPVALVGAHRDGMPPAIDATRVVQTIGDSVDLVIDDGPSRYGKESTVVQLNGETWQVVRPGVLPETLLRRQAAYLIVFVCTGNTCRSPLAEALCKKLLAERLGCSAAELAERGFLVISAGLAAMMGAGAAAEAVETGRELGVDLSGHCRRPLTPQLASHADCLVAMTQGHLLSIDQQLPHVRERCRLLRSDGTDIADPIGCAREVYHECAAEIARYLPPLIDELTGSECRIRGLP